MTEIDPEKNESHELYVKYYEALESVRLSNSEALDKAVLTLSSAGLGISLMVFRFIVPIDRAISIDILKWSWWAFVTAIILTVLSLLLAQKGHDVAVEYAEKYYIGGDNSYANKHNAPAAATTVLSWLSAISFVNALVCLVIFVIKNVENAAV